MGFTQEEQEAAVRRITADKETWLKFMVQEEIGISPGFIDNPAEIGLISAGSFLIGAFPAFFPFFIINEVGKALAVAAIMTVTFLFVLGIAKSKITKMHWLKSGIETLLIGVISCGSGFLLGRIVAGYFH